ncbi:hypothetical protein DL95DRAFT_471980 [Leptodontidium sp. 2 PMI_412]|nr:hypothetical protein DL95DRAFT_471980 [Leptodontidium sp. 2 PMI_412]
MTAFAFVYYDPKPPSKISIRNSSSKFNKNLATNSSSVPVEALPALGRAAGDNDWCQQVVRDSVATVQASITPRSGFDNDIDNEVSPLPRLLSSNYKLESAEELPTVESTVGQGNNQALDDSLLGSRGSQAGSTYDEPIILQCDDVSEEYNNLGPGHARCIVEGGQPGWGTFDMEHLPILSTRMIHEHGDSGNATGKTTPHQTIKRQRSNSPPSTSTSTSGDPVTSLLPRNDDEEGDSGEPRADGICSKRRKVSTPQGRGTVCCNDLSQPSGTLSVANEDSEEDDGTLSISLDARLTSSSRSTPASEVTSPIELEVCPVVTDVDPDWDVREIIGKENFDGVSYYLVDWHPTLLPVHSLGYAKELVDKFEARIRAQRGVNNKRGGLGSMTKQKASVEAKTLSGQQGKKPRGRPRKQT